MRLTRFSDFGLRVLMYLTHERDTPVTVGEIAQQFGVPHNHLVKVTNRLGKLGWVEAIRGRNGGLYLSRPASELRLGDIIRQLEECDELVDCDDDPCMLRKGCQLKGALNAGLAAFYDKMNEYSLADVSRGNTGRTIVRLHRNYAEARESDHA